MADPVPHAGKQIRKLGPRVATGIAIGALLLGSAAVPVAPVLGASAPTFTVNSLADVVASTPLDNGVCETLPGNHVCTLRAAIIKANHFPGGGVTIDLPAGTYDLTILPVGSNDETSGDLNITQTLTLIGAGAASTIIDAHQIDRVFNVKKGSTVSISNITVRNGLVTDTSGGIQNNGTLTLNADVISGNRSGFGSAGGGIANLAGTLTLNNTIVSDNIGGGNGGGVYNNNTGIATLNNSLIIGNVAIDGSYGGGLGNAGTMTLNNSLVSGNQALGNGGGIANFTGTLTETNSTISNNSATGHGGGIYNSATVSAYFMTITGNLADNLATGTGLGGGIYNYPTATLNLKTSLLGQNYAGLAHSDGNGALNSLDYNLIQTTTNLTFTGTTTHNLTGSDPLIDSARMNGGPTPTRALLAGSPAIDAVPLNQCTDPVGAALGTDQRGFPRPLNGACDIGAFEGQQPLIGYGRDLVRNGDAEGAAGSPNGAFVGLPNWQTGAQLMTAVPYNSAGGFPSVLTDPVSAIHGDNFFAGGNSVGAGGTQVIDLSALSAGIDGGGVNYAFSADLGGFQNQADSATVEVDFLNGSSQLLSQVILGPVTAADRGNLTSLLHRSAAGQVPVNTRSVELFVNMSSTNGPFNDGYVDNITLVLNPKVEVFLPLAIR
jgi:CSLREA domain-containing protein